MHPARDEIELELNKGEELSPSDYDTLVHLLAKWIVQGTTSQVEDGAEKP